MSSTRWWILGIALVVAAPAETPAEGRPALDPEGVGRLVQASGGRARVSLHPNTGAARFVPLGARGIPLEGATPQERALDFLERHGSVFGVAEPRVDLEIPESSVDRYGFLHLTFRQRYRGLSVFAGLLRMHFDPRGALEVVNGTFVPGIDVDVTPLRTAAEAGPVAIDRVRQDVAAAADLELEVRGGRLLIFRSGWVERRPGRDHLAYEIEVIGNGIREFVYVDAHTGKPIERFTGVHELLHRTVHEPNFNDAVIWDEGDTLPYSTGNSNNDGQVNGLIARASDVYTLYSALSGGMFLSWDGNSSTMHSIWKTQTLSCPNAAWDGTAAKFCDGVAPDDVVAHEWTHAYTERTHGLIYAWQPGALNEAYSDMFGELIDLIDGTGTDTPGAVRAVGDCSLFGAPPPPSLQVNAPASVAGSYAVSGANFNPAPPKVATANVVLVNDGNSGGGGSVSDGCQSLVGFPSGRIALIDRGNCNFSAKVANAQSAGAVGVVVANTELGGTFFMGGSNPSITIPSVMISLDDGNLLKGQLLAGLNATISIPAATANSVRWLMGEDASAFGGAIRDMWNPSCYGDPERVSSANYYCGNADGGGVHTNSGVPNHAFTLIVDGGTYNGQTVSGIGLTKAAHLYWRAMDVYQVPDTDFADHEDALNQSCADLLGIDLANLTTGAPSGQALTTFDCEQVAEALLAVELGAEPDCNFTPLLDPNAPSFACDNVAFADDFENDPVSTWTLTNAGVFSEYVPRDWEWTSNLPPGGDGSAFFAVDSVAIGDCSAGSNDQSGTMSLESPDIALGGSSILAFEHYVATEPQIDGGQLKIRVNQGPFVAIVDTDFLFNPYNDTLVDSSNNTNPMAGQPAFTGADGGQVHGSWGQSQVLLDAHAGAGDVVRLRFDLGVDGCNGLDGWYVDNVVVCSPAIAAGRLPDGGAVPGQPLLVGKNGGLDITLSWGASCLTGDVDYEIYEGAIGSFSSHLARSCSTSGATSETLLPAVDSSYYLVVPRNASREGSYGTNGAGAERAPSGAACLIQLLAAGCS